MRYLLILFVSINMFNASAQIEATTKEGRDVILYENGSWEYVVLDTKVNANIINVDSVLSVESNIQELSFEVSPRLKKYFGDQKGKIRSRAKCIVENGQVKVGFQWEVVLSDAYRYFGYMKAGKKITLKTNNNEEIVLSLTEDIENKVVEKYNYSIVKGTCLISPDQLSQLLKYSVSTLKVEWKKSPETYQLINPNYFKDTFAALLSND